MAGKAVDGTAPSGGVTGMSVLANAAARRAAIAREGGLCVTCGRPCKPGEARRRIVADLGPDDPMNWVAMCWGCQEALAGRLPPPARFVYHVHDATVTRERMYRLGRTSLVAIMIVSWIGFAAVFGYLLALGAQGLGSHLIATASGLLLLLWALKSWQPVREYRAEQRAEQRQRRLSEERR